jgi:hypothetical protein
MFNPRGYSGVLLDTIKSERIVILLPVSFINFFAIGYVLHGILFGFKALDFSQVLISVTLSMVLFYGELVLLLLPIKVLTDRKIAPDLKTDRDIIRLSFDEQDREIFRRIKVMSNSLLLLLTGLVNYFMIALFLVIWYYNNGKSIPPYTIINGLVPIFGFFAFLNFIAVGYDLMKGKGRV